MHIHKHVRQAGMSLVEIMIVLVIMAIIATAVGVAVLPALNKARIKSTRADAQQTKAAASLWIAEHPGQCPTVDNLVEDKVLDKSRRTTDAWDKEFQVTCEDGDVSVVSGGPNGTLGDDDDIR